MSKFLNVDQLKIGSWWQLADGSPFGGTIIGKYECDIKLLGTDGVSRWIDYWKLQAKYQLVEPNYEQVENLTPSFKPE